MSTFLPVTPDNIPQTQAGFTHWLGRKMLSLSGWQLSGQLPNEKKLLVIVAPHTSNWDFMVGLAAKWALNLKVSFLGKDTLFKGPLGWWMRKLGGIAIDRSAPHGVVGQMVDEFNKREQLLLVIAPEGTRKKVPEWKKGFMFIAKDAQVPVLPVEFDFKHKRIVFHQSRHISSQVEQELDSIKALYSAERAKRPECF
ncbi:lysophospholipid acyltransferase family protein [Thalassotalea mangrovi]|uniref:Acyltransferase n=1 Tax=Thalassotalea mangrovi TaxID=2572245 RepID=A0A4U1B436_9GAMM|nr:lysophospholipid acyltransferase family protein [Thalassotalea mangrovi]TKB44683.1 acyltransferase [Thalassotalea mangrovi]